MRLQGGDMATERYCAIGDCLRQASHGPLCRMHARRRDRDRPMSAPARESYSSPWERLHAAALALADAGPDEEYRAAARRLRDAAAAYARARGVR